MFGGGWGGHGSGFGVIFMLLSLVLLIVLIIGLIRWLSGTGTHRGTPSRDSELTRQARRDEALHILDKRFAHGDIDEEEFLKRRRILKDSD
ncbi:MAG: hypothetical protein B7Y53_00600 [Halothiobacillus sp. 28-55-5]|nr:MAG: hypothetical protein B7Y53_00600 [Halothiobacillus sp. 28-55-5]OZB35648.1 MAG: hypothetical protein B7X44_09180 [Halothiobacillus sp. 15-55-196]